MIKLRMKANVFKGGKSNKEMAQGAQGKENKGDVKLGLNLCLLLGALLNNQQCGAKVEKSRSVFISQKNLPLSARCIIASQMVTLLEIHLVPKRMN